MNSPGLNPGVKISATSEAPFKTQLVHGPSGAKLITEPPADNGGTGAAFSPTDLVASALVSCALTTMALTAHREGIVWGGAGGTVEKVMSPPPRKIAELSVVFQMPTGLTEEQRRHLEEVARQCPVARSLHPDLRLPFKFVYP